MLCKTTIGATVALLLICTCSLCFLSLDGSNNGKYHLLATRGVEVEAENQDQPQQQAERPATIIDTPPSTVIDTAKTFFSLPNTRLALLEASASNYWMKLKTPLFRWMCASFRREDNDQVEANADEAGEKVKEAIVNSLDKSKFAIQDSARSAAKFAGHRMEKTAKKVIKPLSDSSTLSKAEL